jgi:hypothetical protein
MEMVPVGAMVVMVAFLISYFSANTESSYAGKVPLSRASSTEAFVPSLWIRLITSSATLSASTEL